MSIDMRPDAEKGRVLPTPSDAETAALATRITSGDRAAEAELVTRFQRGVRFLLLRKTQGDLQLAEDLCQETLIVAISRLRDRPLDEPGKLSAYIHGIAVRLFIGDLRKAARRQTQANSEAIEVAQDPRLGQAETLSRDQVRDVVRELIDEMPVPRDRERLLRVYVLEQDKPTICQALGLDSVHFNRVLSRARQRLRQLVERSGRLEHIGAV